MISIRGLRSTCSAGGRATRAPTDGGGQERYEAAKYRGDAKASALLRPRTRTVLGSGSPLDIERTQSARIKAPSKGNGEATVFQIHRSRSFMKMSTF